MVCTLTTYCILVTYYCKQIVKSSSMLEFFIIARISKTIM